MSETTKGLDTGLLPNMDVPVNRMYAVKTLNVELAQARKIANKIAEKLKDKIKKERVKANLNQSKYVLLKAKNDLNELQQQKLTTRILTNVVKTQETFSLGRSIFRLTRLVTISLSLVGAQFFLAPLQSFAQSSLRTDGTMLVDGKAFFPIGYYSKWNYTHLERMYETRALGAGGFNLYLGEVVNTSVSDYGLFLDEAYRQKVGVFSKYFGVIGSATDMELINSFKGKPSLLGWIIADDVNNFKPAEVLDFHKRVKAADSSRITYISAYDTDGVEEFMNTTDFVGLQSYPLPQGCCNWHNSVPSPAPHLASTFWYMKWIIDKATPFNRAVMANLQTFKWDNGRWPTAKEADNMSYQAIVAGVKGIAYYTFEDGSSTIDKTHPDVWNATKNVASELKLLAPVLLNGQRTTTVEDAGKAVYSAQWKYNNSVYVIVVNTSNSTKQVSVELPTGTNGALKSPFASRPSDMKFSNNALIGNIAPLDVHIYTLDMNTVSPSQGITQEAEKLPVEAVSNNHQHIFDQRFSGGAGTKLNANAVQDYVTYSVNIPEARKYNVRVGVKKYQTRGKFQLSVNGVNYGSSEDLYADSEQFVELDVADITFSSSGKKSFKFTVVGRNPQSTEYQLHFDYIKLIPR